jgi:hypothetical protein
MTTEPQRRSSTFLKIIAIFDILVKLIVAGALLGLLATQVQIRDTLEQLSRVSNQDAPFNVTLLGRPPNQNGLLRRQPEPGGGSLTDALSFSGIEYEYIGTDDHPLVLRLEDNI